MKLFFLFLSKINVLQRLVNKQIKINYLSKLKRFNSYPLNKSWDASAFNQHEFNSNIEIDKILGYTINLSNIDWHQDIKSEFKFPKKRFDKINLDRYFYSLSKLNYQWKLDM